MTMTRASRLEELQTISAIANRALELYADRNSVADFDIPDDKLTVVMDIEYVHKECPLDLDQFLSFDAVNFAHDMLGIRQHLNRETKQLEKCFQPRCAITRTLDHDDKANAAESTVSQSNIDKYVQSGGINCLVCDDRGSIEGGPVEIDAGIAWQNVNCPACGSEWTDQYNLVGIDHLTINDDDKA